MAPPQAPAPAMAPPPAWQAPAAAQPWAQGAASVPNVPAQNPAQPAPFMVAQAPQAIVAQSPAVASVQSEPSVQAAPAGDLPPWMQQQPQ
jgi:hypothetical protein